MKKILCILGLILTFFIIYFLQVNFFTWFNIAGVMPNMFVFWALFIGLYLGKREGAIVSFFVGIIFDLLVSKNIGISALALSLVSFIGGIFDKNFSKDNRLNIILMFASVTFVYESIIYLFNVLKYSGIIELFKFLKIVFIEIIYNSILAIIFYPLMQKMGNKLEDTFDETKFLKF